MTTSCVHFLMCIHVSEANWFLRRNNCWLFILFFQHCRYHPDKNANDTEAADMFKEVTFSYNILSDPDKRRQYDAAGFEVRVPELYLVQ